MEREGLEREVLGDARRAFAPEFINRLDAMLVFHPLGQSTLESITRQLLEESGRRMARMGIKLEATDEAVALLAAQGSDREYGARPLRRAIAAQVEDRTADLLLAGELKQGDTLQVTAEEGRVQVRPARPVAEPE